MKSLRLKRVASGVVIATATAVMISIPSPALADPEPPANASEALKAYHKLTRKAEKLNEAHLDAKVALERNQKRMNTALRTQRAAEKSEERARLAEKKYRVVVDKFAAANYTGSRLDSISAALAGESVRDFLDRSAAIDVLAGQRAAALKKLTGAVEKAEEAQRTAQESRTTHQKARDEAARNKQDIESRQAALDKQIDEVKDAYDRLSGADLDGFGEDTPAPTNIKAPGPEAQTAVDSAMAQRGDAYVYGAAGPDTFDCSGLTMYAYQQAGISLPHSSSSQSQMGTAVSREQLAPGDLVFFYSPVSHVGMYIGNGQMVHAPQSGDVVKVAPVPWGDFVGARRYA